MLIGTRIKTKYMGPFAAGGGIEYVELICGTEVPCSAYVACDADTVWIVDDAGNYLVDDDNNYIIE